MALLLIGLATACAFGGCKKKDMSMKMNEPRNIHGVQGFQRTFNDQNPKHLKVARAIGVPPVASQEELLCLPTLTAVNPPREKD